MSISPHFEMTGDEARGLLYGLLESNKIQLRKDSEMPSVRKLLQDGKLIYKRADPEEHWQTYRELTEQVARNGVGYGDCEDFATAIAAEDQVRFGVQSLPFAYSPRQGLFHVVTAVPNGSFGQIPRGHWPAAQGAPPKSGYTFQDPSAAAGMGTFGGLPNSEVQMSSSYGATGRRNRGERRGPLKGIAEAIAAFRKGAIGDETLAKVAFEAGTGARGATGLDSGWAKGLGAEIPGVLGVPTRGKPAPANGSAPGGARSDEDEDADLDLDDEEEEFGALYGFDDIIKAGVEEEMGGLIGPGAFHNLGDVSGLTRESTLLGLDDDDFDIDFDDDDDDEEDAFGEYDGYAEGHTPMDRILASEEAYGGQFEAPSHMRPPSHMRTPRASHSPSRPASPSYGFSRMDLFSNSEDLEDTIDEAVFGAVSRMDLFDMDDDD